ncbi:sugar ABC transporter substrate-binding protein [Rhodobacter sp. TJ_12]|uniref:substrate-binding domain-containing protein n=1 Tax=Rhodobacter sp. TJ_12 TaxID=2029399 RepID=UPI001CC180D1|nr:substrate-binding domain-containing protein [Rhodobacter sp. TJ_12]MBZ4021937.1 sugar ABC transporter substrate-binding protein [Rhodobacter sp. TJ_12]
MLSPLTRRGFAALLATASLTAALPAVAQETKTLALVQINQQALFFNEMNRGAEEAAEKAGVNLVIFNANNDSFAQNSAIETYIQEGVDGLAVVAIDVNGIMPAVEQADAAGIPVVAIDAILPEGPQKAQIGVDNAAAGADMAAFYTESYADPTKLGIVGALNSYIQNVRMDGFKDALGADVTIAGTVDGQNIQDVALGAAENLITANPDLNTIYATGEPALMGALAAVESQGKQSDIDLYGWDLTAQAIDAIDAGYLKGVVQQDPAAMGAAAVEALLAISNGETVAPQISVPVTIVTQENVDDFRSLFE